MSIELNIDNEFSNLIPKLRSEEYNALESNILSEGLRDAILTWNNTIIDGHNRYEICRKHGIEIKINPVDFDDRNTAKIWIINNQLARRNLTPYQRAELELRKVEFEELRQKAKKNRGTRTDLGNNFCRISDKSLEPIDIKKELANKINVHPDTASKIIQIDKKSNEATKEKLRSGEISINKAYMDIKKAERKEQIMGVSAKPIPAEIILYEGDIFEKIVSIPENSIDLIIADPPYMILDEVWDKYKSLEEYLCFTKDWLSAVVKKLKDTGRLFIFFAPDLQYYLFQLLTSNNFFDLIYGNTIIWVKRNNNQKFDRKRYRLTYEPIFYLYSHNATTLNFPDGTFGEMQTDVWTVATPQSNYDEGKYHPAQKPIEIYKRIITTASKETETILDPFAGSGTAALACIELGRKCILIEKNAEYCQIIRGRINVLG